jgi:predicted nucleic acid-binding protein
VEPEGYVDVNVFVYWLGSHPMLGRAAYEWIKRIEGSSKGKYVTSSLTPYETLIIIAGLSGKSLGDEGLVREVMDAMENLSGLEITPLSLEDLDGASKLMRSYSLDYEDALHLAVALRCKAKEMVSNDEDFDRTPLKRRF